MEKIQDQNSQKYKMYSYLFIIFSLFILLFITKDEIINLKNTQTSLTTAQDALQEKTSKLADIEQVKNDIKSGKIDKKELDKYLISFNENELTDYFYSYSNSNPTKLKIQSISLTKGSLNEFGFHEGQISLQVLFANEQAMIDTLNFLNGSDKYKLFVHEFTYPMSSSMQQAFSVTLPIKVLYK